MKRNLLILCVLLASSACSTINPNTPATPPQADTATVAVTSTTAAQSETAAITEFITDNINRNATNTAPVEDAVLVDEETPAEDPGNIWDRIRAGLAMPDIDNARIDQQLQWFVRNEDYLDRVAERAAPYMHFIVEILEHEKVPLEIALLPIVESAFQPFAYSHGRASGIWQFIPSTGKMYGLEQNWWYDGRRDIYASTYAAVKLLSALRDEFGGDWLLALAAYNSGSNNVRRAIRLNKRKGKPIDFFSLKLPNETRAYVPKLLALQKIVANPEKYKIDFDHIADEAFFERVDIDSQIDLALVAKLAEMDLDAIYLLNPGFNRWATSPNGPHHLLLPIENADTFKVNLANYPAEKRIQWVRHQVTSGESIKLIANQYQTTPDIIKAVNKLPSNKLRHKQSLMIPVSSQALATYKFSATQRLHDIQNTPQNDGVKITHTVRSGDTWWNIARRHRVGVKQLAKWNGQAPRDKLLPGQELVIWSRNNHTQVKAAVTPATFSQLDEIVIPAERQVMQRIGYRVRRGDTLHRISQKFNVSVDQVKRWNKLSSKSRLRSGQRLTLYVDVTQTSNI